MGVREKHKPGFNVSILTVNRLLLLYFSLLIYEPINPFDPYKRLIKNPKFSYHLSSLFFSSLSLRTSLQKLTPCSKKKRLFTLFQRGLTRRNAPKIGFTPFGIEIGAMLLVILYFCFLHHLYVVAPSTGSSILYIYFFASE